MVSELNGPLRLLENQAADADRNWISVELSDELESTANRHAVGARVEFSSGSWKARRWVAGGGPFQSNWAPLVHAGLPEGADEVALLVTWPDGSETSHRLPSGRSTIVRRTTEGIVTEPRGSD